MKSASNAGSVGRGEISGRSADILTVVFGRVGRASGRAEAEAPSHEPGRNGSFGDLFAELQREGEISSRLEGLAYGLLTGSLFLLEIIGVL